MRSLFFPERLGRLSFFVRCLVTSVLEFAFLTQIENGDSVVLGYTLIVILIIYSAFAIFLPRLLDCGAPKWALVFTLIPYVSSVLGLYLLFRPTEFTSIFDVGGE